MDNLDDDMLEPQVETPPATQTEIVPRKQTQVNVVDGIHAIAPRSIDEAWRLSEAFVLAGMVPDSIKGKNVGETTAKVMAVMLKGLEIGFAPATALQTIMVINGKPCVYGDGVSALLQRSGVVEWIKTETSGSWVGNDYNCKITLKRKDQSEPYERSFGYEDAKKAGLVSKSSTWKLYPERMCYWRALSWAARDGAGDALMGLGIAEEIKDIGAEKHEVDVSKLDD